MEKDSGSWFHHELSDRQSPNLNTFNGQFNPRQQNTISACMSPSANLVSTNGNLPGFAFSGVPNSKAGQTNEPHGWFYCLPRFRQAFTPVQSSIFKEGIPAGPCDNREEVVTPNPVSGCAQKKFLVFDQSGDQTTLMFGSGSGTPFQYPNSWCPKISGNYDVSKIELRPERDTIQLPEPILTDEYNEYNRDDTGSEMHEDTEEINALLYSDDDDDYCSEDDEVASTGHTPSTMTAHNKRERPDESVEEVASSDGPNKRAKLFDGGYVVPSLVDTASSAKPERSFNSEDDAESSCADGKIQDFGEFESLSGNKRSRKDKIRETVSILQSIIPGGEGKEVMVVLDEAINYFRILKHKAKALGVDTL